MKMLSAPTAVADFDIGAVERADRQRAVERQLHVAGARGLHPGGRDLLRQIGGRDDHLGEADIVVRQERDLEQVAHRGVAVDHLGDVVGQLDDQLGGDIARRRLAAEDLDARHPFARRVGAHRVVERHRLQQVQQLALVFVDALDLHVEHRRRDRPRGRAGRGSSGRAPAGWLRLTARSRSCSRVSSAIAREAPDRVGVVANVVAARLAQQPGQSRIGLVEPAAEGDAVGHVDDAVGVVLVEVAEHGLAHQRRSASPRRR